MKRINFNDGWKVWKDDDPFELVFHVPEDAVETDLPYDAMFHEEQKPQAVNGGSTGNIDGGEYKYYKKFFVPEDLRGGHVMLQFEGIYRYGSVFVNQSKVGESPFGYTDFTVTADDYLKYGEENEILVTVKCGTKNSRWYSGAGIYRDVSILQGGCIYVRPYGLRMTTLHLDEEGALVEIAAVIQNDGMHADTVDVKIILEDAKGKTAAENTYKVRLNSRSSVNFRKNVYVDNARLWDEEHPDLYTVKMEISDDTGVLDESCITGGIRTLSVDSRRYLCDRKPPPGFLLS